MPATPVHRLLPQIPPGTSRTSQPNLLLASFVFHHHSYLMVSNPQTHKHTHAHAPTLSALLSLPPSSWQVRSDWPKLSEDARVEVQSSLLGVVQGLAGDEGGQVGQQVKERVCLAFAAACLLSVDGLEGYINHAFSLASVEPTAVKVSLSLLLLTMLPEEQNSLDVSAMRKGELNDQLKGALAQVCALIESVVTDPGMSAASVGGGPTLCLLAIKCLVRWLTVGLNLGQLYLGHQNLLVTLLQYAGGNGEPVADQALHRAACEVLVEITNVFAQSEPGSHEAAVEMVLGAVVASQAAYQAARECEQGEVCFSIVRVAVAVAELEANLIVRGAPVCLQVRGETIGKYDSFHHTSHLKYGIICLNADCVRLSFTHTHTACNILLSTVSIPLLARGVSPGRRERRGP